MNESDLIQAHLFIYITFISQQSETLSLTIFNRFKDVFIGTTTAIQESNAFVSQFVIVNSTMCSMALAELGHRFISAWVP